MKAFFEKVKENVRSDEYLELLKYFHEYRAGRITMAGFKNMVKDSLGEYPGFLYEFLYVFKFSDGLARSTESADNSYKRKKPDSEGVGEIDGYNKKIKLSSSSVKKPNPEYTPRNKTKGHLVQASEFCQKVRKKTSSEEYLALLKCLHDYGTGKITMVSVKIMIADYFPDFMEDFDYVLEFYGSLTQSSSESEGKIGNKGEKPNKNWNITQLDELTPSYKFLPKHASGIKCSGITELGKEVLNFCCFSKGGSYGVHSVWPRNPQEQMLNENEDELFNRDMLMGWMRSTKENATKLYKAIKEGKVQKPFLEDVNNHFTGYNFRFIEKMYDGFGSLVVNQLRHSPKTVLPVLINRLNEMESPSLETKK